MPIPTILVAEDEEAARTSLVALLEAEGFRALTAEEGERALSLALHEEPDAVLLDIRMPKLDGLSVLRQALAGGSDSAFLVMTAFGDSRTAIEAMKLGALDYLSKPLDFTQVLAQLKRAIEHRKLSRQWKSSPISEEKRLGVWRWSAIARRCSACTSSSGRSPRRRPLCSCVEKAELARSWW